MKKYDKFSEQFCGILHNILQTFGAEFCKYFFFVSQYQVKQAITWPPKDKIKDKDYKK